MKKVEMKKAKWISLGLIMALTLTGCGAPGGKGPGMGPEGEEEQDTRILVKTEKPGTQNIEITGDFIGTVENDTEVNVVVKSAGDVTSANFEVGDRVNAGDVLFTIDDEAARLGLQSAQVAASNAQVGIATAQANEVSANKNLINTENDVRKTIGTLPDKIQAIEDGIATAERAVKQAEKSREMLYKTYENRLDASEDTEEWLEYVEDKTKDYLDDLDDMLDEMKALKKSYKDAGDKDQEEAMAKQIDGLKFYMKNIEKNPSFSGTQIGSPSYGYNDNNGHSNDINGLVDTGLEFISNTEHDLEVADMNAYINLLKGDDGVIAAKNALRDAKTALSDFYEYDVDRTASGTDLQLTGANVQKIQSEAGVLQAKNGAKSAQIGLEQAQMALDNTVGKAPVSGLITSKGISINNMANMGTVAYTISSDDELNISFYVAEAVMENLSIGQEIKVERNSNEYTAKISENTGVLDPATGLFKVKANLVDGVDELLSGTSVKISLVTKKAEHVMSVPTDALYYQNEQAYLYIMDGGYAKRCDVEIGVSSEDTTEIKSGLDPNADVIVNYASQLRDGSEVKTSDSSAKAPAKANKKDEANGVEESSLSRMTNGIKSEINVLDDEAMSADNE